MSSRDRVYASQRAEGEPVRYIAAIGGIIGELRDPNEVTNLLFSHNIDLVNAPAEPGGEPMTFPELGEDYLRPDGQVGRRPSPAWVSHGLAQYWIDQSQQAVRGGS